MARKKQESITDASGKEVTKDEAFAAMGEAKPEAEERHLVELTEEQDSLAMMSPKDLQTQIDIETEKRRIIEAYIQANMKKGVDYYTLQIYNKKSGRYEDSKPSLSKPGSEKFMSLFRLRAEFTKDLETWEMLGSQAGYVCYICRLYTKSGQLVGEGRGARSISTDPDINKVIKMAEKSAQIDAILRTGSLSNLFTQDLEDMPPQSIGDTPPPARNQPPQAKPMQTPAKPMQNGNGSKFQFSDRTTPKVKNPDMRASFAQANYICRLLNERGMAVDSILVNNSVGNLEELTMGQASQIIEGLLKQPLQNTPQVDIERAIDDINGELPQ